MEELTRDLRVRELEYAARVGLDDALSDRRELEMLEMMLGRAGGGGDADGRRSAGAAAGPARPRTGLFRPPERPRPAPRGRARP